MNRKQEICLWVGIAVIALMGLFPPVRPGFGVIGRYLGRYVYYNDARFGDFGFIWVVRDGMIEYGKLLVVWVVVAVITGGLIVTFKDKKPKDGQKQ